MKMMLLRKFTRQHLNRQFSKKISASLYLNLPRRRHPKQLDLLEVVLGLKSQLLRNAHSVVELVAANSRDLRWEEGDLLLKNQLLVVLERQKQRLQLQLLRPTRL